MKILALQGSPRKNGNTATLMNQYISGVEAQSRETSVKKVHLDELNVSGCKGCNACQLKKVERCIIQDDMIELYKDIEEADTIILATPLYFFSVTAQMKVVIDRLYALLNSLANKRFVLLTTYGAANDEDAGVNNILNMLEHTCAITGSKFVHSLNISTGYTGQQDVSSNEDALSKAFDLGKTL